ncbi:peptidase family m1 domain-containing protein [Phthorimaea operculella]|nr:peptidase family m1 domain-containing protein [Phthorimaea operculella]
MPDASRVHVMRCNETNACTCVLTCTLSPVDKLRRKYNYTLSLRFITKLDRSDKLRGFYLAGTPKNRCAVSRFWLTHARSAFPCLDEPHFRATFRLTIVRDRFHVSLTNMPIVATEEAGFYLGHRLLQDEFATSPPMAPHMMSLAVCRLQRRAAPPLPQTPTEFPPTTVPPQLTTSGEEEEDDYNLPPPEISMYSDQQVILDESGKLYWMNLGEFPDEVDFYTRIIPLPPQLTTSGEEEEDDYNLPPPEISMYSDQQVILDESGPLLDWVQKTIQLFAYELNTSYPLPKLDLVVVDGGGPYSEGWGLITLAPATLSDSKTIARLLAQQWFGGLVSPRWWSGQWLMEALTSVLGEKAPPFDAPGDTDVIRAQDSLLLDHILPALRLDSSNSVRAVASPRLERADIESAADELSLHKGAAIVSMAIEAAGEAAGRAALARLLRDHRSASADARDLWRALQRDDNGETPSHAPPHAWDVWCEKAGYPLLSAIPNGPDVVLKQERFVMTADPPEPDPPMQNYLLTVDLRGHLDEIFYEPENFTDTSEEDMNATTTLPPPTTRKPQVKTTKPPPPPKWVIPVTFSVGPLHQEYEEELENITMLKNVAANQTNSTWYELVGNDTKPRISRWIENTTHLIWMNDTEMVIPDLGKHKWVRYNVGARGLYRVAPQEQTTGETVDVASSVYSSGAPAERALLLDDAFVLSRARRLPASRAIAAAARLSTEKHWAPWRVVLSHLSWWRSLLRAAASGPHLARLLRTLHPPTVQIYTASQLNSTHLSEDHKWVSGALLSAGTEWENARVTQQAVKLFDDWIKRNISIPEMYQEAAFTAGVRTHGEDAWQACWRALIASYSAPRPLYSHRALLAALASPTDDWLFYRFAYTVMSPEAQRGREWKLWITTLCSATCSYPRQPSRPPPNACINRMIIIGLKSYSAPTAARKQHWTPLRSTPPGYL